jgi:AcrR family transcriptional regulator
MGNREALLAGARRCLEERGWGRTTVRDISAASGGVSMAAIGYHFGSREALLNAALMEAMEDLADEIARATKGSGDGPPADRYADQWTGIIESVKARRNLWLANLEALVQAEHSPELRAHLVAGQRTGRRGSAAGLLGLDEETLPDGAVRTVGSVQLALLLGVMLQWLNDPEYAPSGPELVAGLQAIAAAVESGRTGPPA